MRVLMLSQLYVPEPDIKVHLLGADLARRGHQVTAITGFPNYPAGELYPGYALRWREWEELDGVRILRLPLYPDHSRSSIKRAANYLSFAASASLLGPALAGPADAMWVYQPPLTVGIPAWWIGLLRRIPFVFNIHDMWPETLTATGMMRPGLRLAVLGQLAKFVYRRAAAITVVSPGFKRNLIEKGVPARKIHLIPNWADEDIYYPASPKSEIAVQYGLQDRFNIMYAGNLGAAQALDNVLQTAVRVRDLKEVQFVFIGEGVDKNSLQILAQQRGINNLLFISQQPAERMAEFYAHADVLLVHLKRDPLFEITIPAKTIAYLACGQPILSVVEGDAAQVVLNAGAGLVCPPEDPAALERAVRNLYSMPSEDRKVLGESGRRAFLANYTRAVLMDHYEKVLHGVAESPRNKAVRKARRRMTEPELRQRGALRRGYKV